MTDDAAADPPVDETTATRLLALQAVDSEADLLVHRRERLGEREQLAAATEQLRTWESERLAMRRRIDELDESISRAEEAGADHRAHKTRLEAQMKTVIAPREAEALMHEMTTIDEQVDALDVAELEALEEQSEIDDRLSAHLTSEGGLRAAVEVADGSLSRATREVDAELDALAQRRVECRGALSDAVLARYDRVRSSSGVAITRLVGHRCAGCHLDLSAAEVDGVKGEAAADDGVADCPNCGRMLVP